MRLCQPVASQVGHFRHACFEIVEANFPGHVMPARGRSQGWLIAVAENVNAAQRVQTATGCSRRGRACKRERGRKYACPY